ncbi:MAG: lactate utilization protein C, partial [Nocardioidaceae bacterium]
MTAARDEVLARVRAALGPRPRDPVSDVPRGYRRAGAHPPGSAEAIDLLAERLVDYKATVRRADDAGIPQAVAAALAAALPDGGPVVIPPGLPAGWVPD